MNKTKSEQVKSENAQLMIKVNALTDRCERLEQLALHREQDLKIVLLAYSEHLKNEGVEDTQTAIAESVKEITARLKAEVMANGGEK